jgi:hypothetical protein
MKFRAIIAMLGVLIAFGISQKMTRVVLLALYIIAILALVGCATPHSPTIVLPGGTNETTSGYVYDELMTTPGLQFGPDGKITGANRDWCIHALSRVLDLQQSLDECEIEQRALIH